MMRMRRRPARVRFYSLKLKRALVGGAAVCAAAAAFFMAANFAMGLVPYFYKAVALSPSEPLVRLSKGLDACEIMAFAIPDLRFDGKKDEAAAKPAFFQRLLGQAGDFTHPYSIMQGGIPLMKTFGVQIAEMEVRYSAMEGEEPTYVPPDELAADDAYDKGAPPVIPREIPEGELMVEEITVRPKEGGTYIGHENILMVNRTSYPVDMEELLKAPISFSLDPKKKQVLIIHTHGTECYNPEGKYSYDPVANGRSHNPEEGVIAVGEVMAARLEALGIGVIHDKTTHDFPSYNGSYNNANATIMALKEKNPDISVIIDVHRDALEGENRQQYNPLVIHEGEKYAQLMLVMGTDEGGLKHDNWRENLKLGFKLHNETNKLIDGIFRPMSLRPQRFNQHQTPGSILLEVGTNASTLEQAKRSALVAADVLAKILKKEIGQ